MYQGRCCFKGWGGANTYAAWILQEAQRRIFILVLTTTRACRLLSIRPRGQAYAPKSSEQGVSHEPLALFMLFFLVAYEL